MRNFIEDRHSGRRGSDNRSERRGGGNRFGGRDSSRREVTMYPAVCDECGKDCEVPFKPTSSKPIYCSRCFEKQGGYDREERGGRDDRGGRRERSGRDSDKQMFSAVCDDCGKDCEVPFRPSGDKPIYCSRCFENRGNSHEGESKREVSSYRVENRSDNGKQNEQFELLNAKLDQILLALEKKTKTVKKVQPIEMIAPVQEEKATKAKKTVKKAKKE